MRRQYKCRLSAAKPYNRASPVENRPTALRAMEMHPYSRCAVLPPPGEVPPQVGIGVHFHERSEVCLFSLRAKGAVVKVLS